ncbi:cyclin [Colletotrichum karsti]|uniref:Cyclin n=1 Tax=Colletotrichum karsti TaxID=1095194 RepID=A0A9P6LEY9_9PEZI|nr:cyclin [Colletotrichum karsti]KAF9870616.1 cyclin [Colletotrichum karsti]
MIATSGIQHQHSHESHYRSASRSREAPTRRPSSPRYSSNTPTRQKRSDWESAEAPEKHAPPSGGASRFPSPPSSSSPTRARPQHAESPAYMATDSRDTSHAASVVAPEGTAPALRQEQQQPSPASDGNGAAAPSYPLSDTSSPRQEPQGQTTIHIRDLAHIQSLAQADMVTGNGPGILGDPPLQQMKYEISAMPIGDIIEMVAALLTKITTTNDLQHDAMQRNVAHQQQASQNNESGNGTPMSPLSTSVLAFHGKNIPAITILSYLSRIHKYCPTTYEVFLSLLVYFDRMTERVNEMVVKHEEARRQSTSQSTPRTPSADVEMRDDDETDSDLADDDDMDEKSAKPTGGGIVPQPTPPGAPGTATYFVVDSFNIHRLIIAGVTCASKFFSDVFYTNSRYAKVGGLPLAELNHLELQFLLLNDFRLAVPVEDLEAYATMLVEFYAREVVAQRSRPAAGDS